MAKTIILCLDGTYNQIGLQGTNVLRLFQALVCDEKQLVFYNPGVGTLTDPNSFSPLRQLARQAYEMATGASIGGAVIEAYDFLVRHYKPGDRICLFGFSRGAYTAKAVAGLLHMVGLLRPEHANLVPYAWQAYRNGGNVTEQVTEIYRTFFSYDAGGDPDASGVVPRTVGIDLLGLWDTVSSYGFVWDFRTLRYTRTNPSVRVVRHALALDERRVMFKANHCAPYPGQDLHAVWFVGCHSDVGGHPEPHPELSDIAFRWMAGEASAFDIRFDPKRIAEIPTTIPSDPNPSRHESMDWYWKIAEWLPRVVFNPANNKRKIKGPNRGAYRTVRTTEDLHETVADWIKAGTYRRPGIPEGMRAAKTRDLPPP